jgi:hypothetical protein
MTGEGKAAVFIAVDHCKETYNRTWIIERHGYQTPAQVRANQIGPMSVAA